MLTKFDFEISLAVWLASAVATYWFHPAILIFGGATFNLWHQRTILFNAGAEFAQRVKDTLAADIAKFDERMRRVELDAKSVKDAQNSIQSALGKGPQFGR